MKSSSAVEKFAFNFCLPLVVVLSVVALAILNFK